MTDDTQILLHPRVDAFADEVRARLGDLTDEQREELLDGLAADLTEQLADGAEGVLDDPAAYAAELRAAAGLPEQRRRTLPRLQAPTPQRVEATLDRARDGFLTRVGDTRAWEVVEALRPAWWVARAWIAVTLVDKAAGSWEPVSLVPSLDIPGLGPALLVAAVIVSALIGLDRLWPGSGPDRPLLARLVLLALNVAAMLVPMGLGINLPGYLGGEPEYAYASYNQGYRDASRELSGAGLRSDGEPVRNIFAYDAQGRPIAAVQLFDQNGDPLALTARQAVEGHGGSRQVGCAWLNGTSPQYNVFPLAERLQRYGPCTWTEGTGRVGPVEMPTPPLAVVPPVVLPEGLATAERGIPERQPSPKRDR